MKRALTILGLLASITLTLSMHAAQAAEIDTSDLGILTYALSSDAAKTALSEDTINNVNMTKENIATTWNYTITIESSRPGLGMDGASSRPCFTELTLSTIGGVAGTDISEVKALRACAENSMMK